jgi:hypothetical protein
VPHTHQWATCYRIGTIVNTNMYTESFRRQLKVVYLNNKHNCRVDKLIIILLRFARNLIYERLHKVEIGKNNHTESLKLINDTKLQLVYKKKQLYIKLVTVHGQ